MTLLSYYETWEWLKKVGNTWEATKQEKVCFPVKVIPKYILQ